MWRVLFGQAVFCFYSAGMCWASGNSEMGAAGFTFAALGVISVGSAAQLRPDQLERPHREIQCSPKRLAGSSSLAPLQQL